MNPYRILAVLCCLAISAVTALGASGKKIKKISDYTQTLTIGDAWIYEIAVPGVTNYKVTFGTMATNIIARVPTASSAALTNKIENLNGRGTNAIFYGNTGFGTTNPTALVTVSNTTPTTPSLAVYASGNPIPSLLVGSDGFVGIGTTGLVAKLTIGGYSGTAVADTQVSVSRLADDSVVGHGHAFSDSSGITRTGMDAFGYNSYDSVVAFSGSGNVDHYAGFQERGAYGKSGTITDWYGLVSLPSQSAGTIVNRYGLNIWDVSQSGGVIQNNYGLYIKDLTAGSNYNYAVYTAGLANSYFGGSVGLGILPLDKLQIQTAANAGTEKIALSLGSSDFGGTVGDIQTIAWRNSGGATILGKIQGVLTDSAMDLAFQTYFGGLSERMRITGTGNVGIGTNAPGYKLEVNGTARITGAVMLNNGSPAAGQVPTFRSDGTIYPSNVVATASGTNYPPVTTTGTNITVGTGVRKSLLMPTNSSVGISFNGTEILGETLTIVVTNTSATASNITISVFQDGVAASYFDSTVASNVTGFLVVSNSSKRMEFVYNGSFWRLESTIAKEMELSVAGGLSLTTNSVTSIVTLSNSMALQQLNNVGIGTPAAGDVLSWSLPMSKWTNTVVPGGDVISNITVSATNNVLLDFAAANIFKLTLLTNWTHTFTNATSLTKKGYVYFQQDTNGNRMLNNYSVSGGLLQTNASENMQPTTNANALDLLELMPGFFTTNLIAYWPQDFQPRIKFTNSLHAFLSFIDTFNRSNADPMSTTASDGHSWTSGPGALAEPRIVSSMLFGNAGQTGCRVLTPTMGGNQTASLTLIGNVGALGPMVHVQSTVDASGYFLVADDSTHLAIYKLTDTGSLATSILFTSAATPTMVSGDTITLTINGITLECFLNGVSYGTVDDATFSGGQPGIWMNSDSASGGPFSASEQ